MSVPKTVALMKAAGFGDDVVDQLVWKNPVGFFARFGRAEESEWETPPASDLRQTFGGNTILRGQNPEAPKG